METLKKAFKLVSRKNVLAIFVVTFLYSLIEVGVFKKLTPYMATGSIQGILRGGAFSLALAVVVYWLLRIIFLTGFIPMVLGVVFSSDMKVSLAFFRQSINKKNILNMTVLELVVIPVLFLGSMLLVIPGLFWFVITIFSYFIISSSPRTSVLDAISNSFELTKGYRWRILFYMLIYLFVSFFASLTLPLITVIIEAFIKALFFVAIGLVYKEALEKNA